MSNCKQQPGNSKENLLYYFELVAFETSLVVQLLNFGIEYYFSVKMYFHSTRDFQFVILTFDKKHNTDMNFLQSSLYM